MAKKTPVRTDRVTYTERMDMAVLKAAGQSVRSIAKATNRARQTVTKALSSEEVEARRVKARDLLDRNVVPLAEHYLTAVEVGASKGRHEGAYHGLLSLGVISRPDAEATGPRIVVNVGQIINQAAPDRGLPERVPVIEGVSSWAAEDDPLALERELPTT